MSLRGAAKQQAEDLSWLPDEYRDIYFEIAGKRQFSATEAKRITLAHIQTVERRRARAA